MIRFLNVYYPTRTVFLVLSEALIVSGCFMAAVWIVLQRNTSLILNYQHGAAKILAVSALTLIVSYYFDLYEPELLFDRREIYFRILLAVGLVCLFVAGILYFYPGFEIAEYVFLIGFLLVAVGLMAWRKFYSWIAARRLFRESVYILGEGPYAEMIAETIDRRKNLGMDIIGCNYEMPDGSGRAPKAADAVKSLLKMKHPIHRLVIAMEDRRRELPMTDLLALRFKGVVVEDASTLMERLNGKIQLDGLRPSSFLYAEGFRIKPSQQFTRRVASIMAATVGLLLFLPFLPFVMLAVRLSSPGPIFFSQVRVGEGGKTFKVHKFRTMRQDAEAGGAKWASKNDPRTTRIGLFMRKTRIDEIPQLWNVLRGDMAFVGPRPERPEFVPWLAEQLPFYELRHIIRPGLTGWAQVRYGYGATLEESRQKLEFDLYYVKHASLGLDLLIMFETIKIILHRKGAQ